MIGKTILQYEIIEQIGEVRLVPISSGRPRPRLYNFTEINYDW